MSDIRDRVSKVIPTFYKEWEKVFSTLDRDGKPTQREVHKILAVILEYLEEREESKL